MKACLDSWAVLAWLDGEEPAASRVEEVLEQRPVISWINVVEVYSRVDRDHGRRAADEVLADLRATLEFELPGVAPMVETARLKSSMAIALADCFAIATATALGLTLLTGDPEILNVADLPCAVEDIRGATSEPTTP